MKLHGLYEWLETKKAIACLVEKHVACEWTSHPVGDAKAWELNVFRYHENAPVLVDEHVVAVGPMAIWSHLEAKYPDPPLLPRDPQGRAIAMYIEERFASFCDVVMRITSHTAGEWYSRPEEAEGWVKSALRPILGHLEGMKKEHRYIASNEISIADISVGTALMHVSKHAWLHVSGPNFDPSVFTKLAPDYPLMAQYCEELWDRPSFQATRRVSPGLLAGLRMIAEAAPKCGPANSETI